MTSALNVPRYEHIKKKNKNRRPDNNGKGLYVNTRIKTVLLQVDKIFIFILPELSDGILITVLPYKIRKTYFCARCSRRYTRSAYLCITISGRLRVAQPRSCSQGRLLRFTMNIYKLYAYECI